MKSSDGNEEEGGGSKVVREISIRMAGLSEGRQLPEGSYDRQDGVRERQRMRFRKGQKEMGGNQQNTILILKDDLWKRMEP